MYLSAETLDDLLFKVYRRLLRKRGAADIIPTKGPATEINGVLLQIKNPRARLSRTENRNTPLSCLGEFLWYISASDDLEFIQYYIPRYKDYSDDGYTIYGAYGPRLFALNGEIDQVRNVTETLKANPASRRAVIQLFRGEDLADNLRLRREDLPCTCTLQFTIRNHQLNLMVMMRSNDAYLGLPHDVFSFTMLQELVARAIGVEIGTYKHAVGSLHFYTSNTQAIQDYLDEGMQERVAMPPMPQGDPWPSIEMLMKAEATIRSGKPLRTTITSPYWGDLVRLLEIFRISKNPIKGGLSKKLSELKNRMSSDFYDAYILKRQNQIQKADEPMLLFDFAEVDAQQPTYSQEESTPQT